MAGFRLDAIKNILGWLLLFLTIMTVAGQFMLPVIGCDLNELHADGDQATLISSVGLAFAMLAFAAIGRLLTLYRPENRIGWIMAVVGLSLSLANTLNPYLQCALEPASRLPFAGMSAWVMMIAGNTAIILLFILLPALFPTGTSYSRAWNSIIILTTVGVYAMLFIAAIAPGPMTLNGTVGAIMVDNPFGVPLPGLRRLENFLFYGIPVAEIAGSLLGIAAFISRFRRSSSDERLQLKWFAFFLMTVVVVHLVGFELLGGLLYPAIFEHWSYGIILTLSFSGFPLVMGLAIFKYRLYDIDILIRRTLQYSILTGLLGLVYFGGVTLLQGVFTAVSGQQSPAALVLSTLGIAALFNPLRRRVQDFIDRRFYRQKYDAEKALADFAAAARQETDLEQLVNHLANTVQETVQPVETAVWLRKTHL